MSDDGLKIKGRVPRGTEDELRIRTGVSWKKQVIDIRWYKQIGDNMTPTKKGVRMNIDEFNLLMQVLKEMDWSEDNE